MKEGACIIVTNGDKVLLGRRLGSYMPGRLGLPGGTTDGNEEPKECARRELREETGLDGELAFFETITTKRYIHHIFIADNPQGVPQTKEPNKCEGWEWLPASEARNLVPAHRQAIKDYGKTI